ncbi:uncharacterized protein C8A04DRAFT_37864 [Dichotomopilus funicola]|uniref:Uncharacterized protein n=1 Tax=Dichotomopilus funicola TaxID=1934379 RepID=A0AAN6V1C1_9PEZI|nr:hypothetical protein C8A04DRAFT_37864 [Dichotomopilus funicola]
MAIYTGGKSKAISSPRHLTLRHARRKTRLSKIARGLLSAAEDDQPVLKPGEEKLNSFWAPGLEAGPKHIISATQTIKSNNQPDLVLTSEQDFYVDAPQFSLPEGSVYSVFPPSGYPEDANILPHVVLSDPHLPWERRGSPKDDHRGDKRNKVPWLMLFSFTQEELKLAPDAFGGSTEVKQTPTGAVNMTVGDLWDITGSAASGVTTPITKELGPENIKDARGDFIFVKPDLFKSMFSTFDDNNTRVVPASPDTTKYKYLAHVRNINTTGMAEAGKEDVGIFSVVVGSRAGVLANTAPTAVSVHLVSIEGVEEMTSWADDKKYIALCSLHSWNYTVNPPGTLNVHDAFVHLGETLDLLRAPDAIINPLLRANDKVSQRLAQRLQDGYSLVKYRVQTGEKTMALYRGPFTPTVVAPQGGGSADDREVNLRCSNSGQDLQVLDREVGLMDVSYSVAWQVGRMLALGDQGFAAALVRHRVAIQGGAMKAAKVDVVRGVADKTFRTRTDLLADLKETAGHLGRIHLGDDNGDDNNDGDDGGDPPRFLPGSPRKRWHRPRLPKHQYPPLHFNAPDIKTRYLHHATNIAHRLAQSKSGPGTIYDETNDPVSTDWMQILAWILDRMFLSGIPSHYLLTDPSHLPTESLRFFYIDPNWVDALIDGALSLGNHMGEDRDRVAIKQAINTFLHHVPEHQTHAPQIPTYGFYLRSDLVTMFPDLKVSTEPEPPKGVLPDKAPLLRHEIVADGVMLGLLDRLPDPSVTSDFQGLCFTQPPHQQRFAVGYELSAEKLSIDLRHQYTVDQETRETDKSRHKPLVEFSTTPSDTKNWFTWSSDPSDETKKNDLRVVRLPFYAEEQTRILMEKMDKKYFDDDQPNAALLGMQLNDAFYRLVVSATEQRAAEAFERIREDGPPKVRALGRLGVPYIRRSLSGKDGDEGEDNERGDTGDGGGELEEEPQLEVTPPNALFQRHPTYRPHPSTLALNRSPHVRNLPIPLYDPSEHGRLPPTRTPPNEPPSTVSLAALTTKDKGVSADKTDPAGPPIFSCYTFTSGYGSVQTNADPLPQDMIFSIQATNTASSNYQLIEFQIWVPLGTVDNPDNHCLFPSYSGPGARMLSNLRFNVLPMLADMQGVPCLVFRLLPRSASGWTSVRPVRELSFLLCLATPNGTYGGGASTLVTLYTAAYYKYVAEKTPVQGKFVVALKKNEDV